jgi:CBS domain-containing protein
METGFKVCDAMTREPVVVSPNVSIQECAKIMSEHKVGALIVKEGSLPVGIITEQDIVRKAVTLNHIPSKKLASEIMEPKINTIEPEKDIYDALMKMRDLNIRHLPVMSGKSMVGLLTLKDVLKIEPQLFDMMVDRLEVREQERKPVHVHSKDEGICQECGEYAKKLYEKKGSLTCMKCLDR